MPLLTNKKNKQVKIIENKSQKSQVYIFSEENTNYDFEEYIDSLMDKESFYGEPIY